MTKVVECIPNISEGRDLEVVGQVAETVKNIPGVTLLDCSSDPSHNRSVITFIGPPGQIVQAAVKLAGKAVELIDLAMHEGEHPRIGSVDVIPFVPLRDASMEECVGIAVEAARLIWHRYALPAYLYGHAARDKKRVLLSEIRRGQFEGLPAKMKSPEWSPDFGGAAPHPTAGAVAVGARGPLVAFNVNLDTPDAGIARAIAKKVRQSSGGLDCVMAIGIKLEGRGIAQVSMNMTDTRRTSLHSAYEAVRSEAQRHGAPVIGSEIVGLAPMGALLDSASYYLGLDCPDIGSKVLEKYL